MVSDSLWPHVLQHTRLPCSLLSPGGCANSCSLSQWCHPTIPSTVAPSLAALSLSQHQGFFPMCLPFSSDGQNIGTSASGSVLSITQGRFHLDWLFWFPYCPRDSLESSTASTIQKHQFFSAQPSFYPTLTSVYKYWKNHLALTRWTFVGKVMSTQSFFSKEQVPFNFMAVFTALSDFGDQKKKKNLLLFPLFPICLPWSNGPDAMILGFWMLSFKPAFYLSSFTCIERLFSSSSLSAIRLISSTYLRLFIFLLVILIPVYTSSSLVFHAMFSKYKLNKQVTILTYSFRNLEPVHCFMSCSNCCFLIIIQVSQETGKVVWYSHLFKKLIHTV